MYAAVAGCLDYPDFRFRVKKSQMPLHSELLFNALCDSGCPDWVSQPEWLAVEIALITLTSSL